MADSINVIDGSGPALGGTIRENEELLVQGEPGIPPISVQQPLERYDSGTRQRTQSARRTLQHGWEQPGVLNSLSQV